MTAPVITLVSPRQRQLKLLSMVLILILYVGSFWLLKLDLSRGLSGFQRAFEFMGRMILMDFNDWRDVAQAALESISVAVLATILSACIALPVSFFAAVNISNRYVAVTLKAVVAVVRAIPTVIWTLIFVAYLGFGPFPGVLGLFFHSFAYLVKAFSESIEEVKSGAVEAMRATGASWIQIMGRGVFPSVQTALISWTALRFEINIGQSAILGLVGAGGIGAELAKNIRIYDFNRAGLVILVIFLMSFGVEMFFNRFKLNVDKKKLEP